MLTIATRLLTRHTTVRANSVARLARRRASVVANDTCWKCHRPPEKFLFCKECDTIQKPPMPDDQSLFDVFQMEERFDLDQTQLAQQFKKMQVQVHPDKWSHSSDAEHQVSKDFSAFLNSAYQTLKLPAKRAEYMLNRRGIALEDASLDQNFLVEMMELRSDIEELAGDAGTAEQLRALQATVDDAMRQDSAALTAALAAHNDNEAKTRTLRLRYWQRAATAIDDALP